MFRRLLDAAGLNADVCATLLGINPQQFDDWSAGRRPVPESILPLLSAVLGVPASALTLSIRELKHINDADIVPAIWYKFRGPELSAADRECVVLIRQLGHFVNELEDVTKKRSVQWKTLFE